MIDFYNEQSRGFKSAKSTNKSIMVEQFINTDERKISWNRNFLQDIEKHIIYSYKSENIVTGLYRPFCKCNLYFDQDMNAMLYQNKKLFPKKDLDNIVICVSGRAAQKPFSAFVSRFIPDLQVVDKGQCFPLYYYEEQDKQSPALWDVVGESDYIRRDGVSDFILDRAKKQYGKNVSKEDIFYYVYGILHSPEYRTTFANDLKKALPRIPLVEDVKEFWKFSKTGRQLAELHINYESVPPYKGVKVSGDDGKFYKVEKMRFPAKGEKHSINLNSKITVSNIPAKAYEYVVNGKSAIEWVMERYQVTTHPESGITNDPNDWAKEVGNPRYILDLLLSVINVSVQTVALVSQLPKVKFE